MIKIYEMSQIQDQEIFLRSDAVQDVSRPVSEILQAVRAEGDRALLEYTKRFDKAELTSLAVSGAELERAMEQVEPAFLAVLREAAENIRAYHAKQKRESFWMEEKQGVILGQKVLPLARVGIYVPGGTAAYPSTVLMNAIPAQIAGVEEIIMVTPPSANGEVNPHILAAAGIAGVTRIFKVGGAQAIGALAYGTESIPRVDKIVGPGNAYVAEAKRQVFGRVNIDMIAGPSEVLVIADETANPTFVAIDLLAQAEHDPNAKPILVSTSQTLVDETMKELQRLLPTLATRDVAEQSWKDNGAVYLADSIQEAIELSNTIAPEHLEVQTANEREVAKQLLHYGSLFVGHYAPVAFGDFVSGPNHTLPTMGTARFYSPLSVDDFIKRSQFSYYTREALERDCRKVGLFARREGLTAHARAVEIRFEGEEGAQ